MKDLTNDAQVVYDKCLQSDAVTQSDIESFLPDGRNDVQAVSDVINTLLSRRLLEAMHQGNGLVYRAINQTEARRMGDMDGDEAMIYQYIKSAGNEGIWSRHIKARTNLHATVITRNLKTLESKSLVKCIRSVQNPTRKIYMLYDLTPSIEVSGGPWFTDSELDVEFVQRLSDAIEEFIRRKTVPKDKDQLFPSTHTDFPTTEVIHDWLKSKSITEVSLGQSEIKSLLNVLSYDGKIEARLDGSYKTVRSLVSKESNSALTEMPCGHCPVLHLCQEGGVVSPEGCVYWSDWIDRVKL